MQISLRSKKAINFDLQNSLLKQYYPSNNYKNAWRDIKRYLENNNFMHRQYSGYVLKDCISMIEVCNIAGEMAKQYIWLGKCVKQFDVTIVGNEYSLLSRIKDKTGL